MVHPKDVDTYIAEAPHKLRSTLRELRTAIRRAAPEAEERISYGMPYYHYRGRLAYFQLAKSHIGLYIPPPVVQQHKQELKGYETATATIRFPVNRKLPLPLIRKLIRARMILNEEKQR
jgi:uncharacterized protein YdhG (YjbR/CyaY superfamily)